MPVKQRSFRQLRSFSAVYPDLVRILGASFSFLEERKGAMKAIFTKFGFNSRVPYFLSVFLVLGIDFVEYMYIYLIFHVLPAVFDKFSCHLHSMVRYVLPM